MLRDELENEIEEWKEKLDARLSDVESLDESGKWILNNARAYREDSNHFFKNGDLIESYESLIWAWAFVEIGEKLEHLSFSKE